MKYSSLFERAHALKWAYRKRKNPTDPNPSPFAYKGALEMVLDDLKRVPKSNLSEEDVEVLVTRPQLIIRSCLDHKIDRPENSHVELLVLDSIDLALGVYTSGFCRMEQITCFANKIRQTGNQEILARPLVQKDDPLTWSSSTSHVSKEASDKLNENFGQKNLLFIALGHGSIAAGTDVFLRYTAQSQNRGLFYAVRYSRHKLGDKIPRVSEKEIAFLQRESQSRDVLIFDDDMGRYNTLLKASHFFLFNIFTDKQEISGLVNQYKRFFPHLNREYLKRYSP